MERSQPTQKQQQFLVSNAKLPQKNILFNLKLQQSGQQPADKIISQTNTQLLNSCQCLFDPSFEAEGVYQTFIHHIARFENESQNRLFAVVTNKIINIYDPKDYKVQYRVKQNTNQMEQYFKLCKKASLENGKTNNNLPAGMQAKPSYTNFLYGTFHNIDGGILFAGDNKGSLSYYDMNSLCKENTTKPSFEFEVSKNSPIYHISQPFHYIQHNQLGLSMGLGGGVSFFDIRSGERTIQQRDLHAIKTRYYPENCNYVGVLTVEGSLEMYDVRNFNGSVAIYSEDYYKEIQKQAINKELQAQMMKELSEMKKQFYSDINKRQAKQKEKAKKRENHELYQSLEQSTNLKVQEQKQVNNIEHFKSTYGQEKFQLQGFRNQIPYNLQITDFQFISNTSVCTVHRSGIIKTYDFFSSQLEKINHEWLNEDISLDITLSNQQLISTSDSNNKYFLLMSGNKIGIYDIKRDKFKSLIDTRITTYTSLALESGSIDFKAEKNITNLTADSLFKGGFIVGTSSAGILRYQLSQCNI